MKEYRVFYSNHAYFADRAFKSFEDALAHAKNIHFDAQIYELPAGEHPYSSNDVRQVGSWSVFGGTRDNRKTAKPYPPLVTEALADGRRFEQTINEIADRVRVWIGDTGRGVL